MNTICPVCNGFADLRAACPTCKREAEDGGRLADYYDPYSAYRPIDEVRLTNGYPDVAARECLHKAYCANCGAAFVAAVPESEG
ncbi:hypothetical protein [Paenibacillus sp.]|uniref:hypothetical protein n=1 Tax=Paenibacillus sp. TaxID=58172 RepID=UPI002811D19E|nr:hypothetical protein [Paenibacillus sp.]